ncbi:T9SS type A sorting domain-containing protein [Flavobacterium sp. F-65]|uniref:T9SS type A sorting domain-containing protein n=1 Tax=Flavobacterium pisciphilum TaxID=2893755 RepID=A0ABS8MP38_9FLAO|nr:T9SS type A sorting domain-containing protein [Flavobacterium sp. F-65]MCC9070518.1 T9SS type A sorting domain-containing protein [Flavobacterium sp. F-65]
MKRYLLLVLFMMVTSAASAQYTIWEDDFDDAEASDWTLLDKDGNGSNWIARKNIQLDANTGSIGDGTIDVLGTYNIDFATGSPLETLENNLAITPSFDTSFYSGKISLILNAQPSIYDSNQDLSVYGSTTPDPASFTLIKTITLEREKIDAVEFKDYTVDISSFSGKKEVYIALGNNLSNGFIGYEIDKISITAEGLLGVDDMELKAQVCKLVQNPVEGNLSLELGEQFQNDETVLKIYTVGGMIVKEAAYKKEGLAVDDLTQGIYFLLVSNNGISKTIKFIKK